MNRFEFDAEDMKRAADEAVLKIGEPQPRNRAERRRWAHSSAGRAVEAEIARRAAIRAQQSADEEGKITKS